MSANLLIQTLALVTLVEMMVTIGLGVTFASVLNVVRDWRLVVRSLFANYLCVPAAALGLLVLFHASPMVSAGFLIVAVCPGAPYGPPFAAMARGDVAGAVGLMVILAGSSALLAPLLLKSMLPVVAGSEPLTIDGATMVGTLAISQFVPLCAGICLRHWKPALAATLRKPLARLSLLLNLMLIGTVLFVQFQMLKEIQPLAYLGMLALVTVAFASGWLVGGPGKANRKTLALSTSVRNVGVALVIDTTSFPGTPAITAATAYGLFQTIVMALVAMGWGRLAAATDRGIYGASRPGRPI